MTDRPNRKSEDMSVSARLSGGLNAAMGCVGLRCGFNDGDLDDL